MSLVLFADISNMYFATRKQFDGGIINYLEYRNFIEAAENQKIMRSFAYGVVEPDNQSRMSFFAALREIRFETKISEIPEGFKYVQWNIPMIIDVMKAIPHYDTFVIGSNDLSLVPLVNELKDNGKRVVVFASRISRGLKQVCHQHYEIDGECDLIINQEPVG